MKPTSEQAYAIEMFDRQDSMKINAYAGTGKTRTLAMMASRTSRRGLYLAFNKRLAVEAAEKFAASVTCKTTHALAYSAIARQYGFTGEKMTGSLNAHRVADLLDLRDLDLGAKVRISRVGLASLVHGTVRRFRQSDDQRVAPEHVPPWGYLRMHGSRDRETLVEVVATHAATLWSRMIDPSESAPMEHDGYLKLWLSQRRPAPFDYLMLDEAQDTNPAVAGWLASQQAQIIYVGDRYQQIYEWRGAVNAMDQIALPNTTRLTHSFRFGRSIADIASKFLSIMGESVPVCGSSAIASTVTFDPTNDVDAVVCRSNATVVASAIKYQRSGKRVCIVGGGGPLLRLLDGVDQLKQRRASDLPEFFGFKDWASVVEYSRTEAGVELRPLVKIVGAYEMHELRRALTQTEESERDADIVISTTHKAKGREWSRVEVTGDHLPVYEGDGGRILHDRPECQLYYVALTRAKEHLVADKELTERADKLLKLPPSARSEVPF